MFFISHINTLDRCLAHIRVTWQLTLNCRTVSREVVEVLVYLKADLFRDEHDKLQADGALVLRLVEAAVVAAANVSQELQRHQARDLAQHVGRGDNLK